LCFDRVTHPSGSGELLALAVGPVEGVDIMSWFSVKMTAVGVALQRIRTSPIAPVMVPEDSGASRVTLAALAGCRRP
jgi:hypothetical protein